MQVHLRLDLAGRRVHPLAAAVDHGGRSAKQGFQRRQRGLPVLIALDGKPDTFVEIVAFGARADS